MAKLNIVLLEPEIPANTGNIGRTCVATDTKLGKESAGIPEEILMEHKDNCVRIPMINEIRSLNLSNSVAIVLYEALRQNHFDHMQLQGQLHNHTWE